MIDFKELATDGRAFELLIREMLLISDLHPFWTGSGPDQGRDIIATEKLSGVIRDSERKWLVQCKHKAHSGAAVGRGDLQSVVDDCRQVGATGYFLACSTHISSSLVVKLKEIEHNPENKLVVHTWDSVDIEKRLQEPRFFSLAHVFFPQSMAAVPWKLYNRGSPNRWTGHFKTYFLHLNSRIAGSHPDLKDCETIINRLESVTIKGADEKLRPRAIYFDNKHEQFMVFADYLVPKGAVPSLLPGDFEEILKDGESLYQDDVASWYSTMWDIRLTPVTPSSDHYDKDHYRFYDPFDGNFASGMPRSDYTVGDQAGLGNQWRS